MYLIASRPVVHEYSSAYVYLPFTEDGSLVILTALKAVPLTSGRRQKAAVCPCKISSIHCHCSLDHTLSF